MEYGSRTTPHFQEVDQVRCEVCDGLSLPVSPQRKSQHLRQLIYRWETEMHSSSVQWA